VQIRHEIRATFVAISIPRGHVETSAQRTSSRRRIVCVEMEAATDPRRHNDASSHAGEGAVLVGYARVATADQFEELKAQTRDLRAAGAETILTEYGSLTSRVAPPRGLASLRAGDALVVTTADRLTASAADLLALVDALGRRGVNLVVLSIGEAILDTRNQTAEPMLAILRGIAAWERAIAPERKRDAMSATPETAKYKGRPPTVARQGETIRRMVADGEKPVQVARKLGVGRSSVYRVLNARAPV
jgi:DNA invertase Pin-like site-specific DNA recombinase